MTDPSTPECHFANARREWLELRSQVRATKQNVEALTKHTENLTALPELARAVEKLSDGLMKQATDKTPYLLLICVLGMICAAIILKDSPKNLSVSRDGINLSTVPPGVPPRDVGAAPIP